MSALLQETLERTGDIVNGKVNSGVAVDKLLFFSPKGFFTLFNACHCHFPCIATFPDDYVDCRT